MHKKNLPLLSLVFLWSCGGTSGAIAANNSVFSWTIDSAVTCDSYSYRHQATAYSVSTVVMAPHDTNSFYLLLSFTVKNISSQTQAFSLFNFAWIFDQNSANGSSACLPGFNSDGLMCFGSTYPSNRPSSLAKDENWVFHAAFSCFKDFKEAKFSCYTSSYSNSLIQLTLPASKTEHQAALSTDKVF